jgi:hypothetical protein
MVADLRQSIVTYKVLLVTNMYIHAVSTQLLTSLTGTTNYQPETPNNLYLNPTKLFYNLYTTSKSNIMGAQIGGQEKHFLKIYFVSP